MIDLCLALSKAGLGINLAGSLLLAYSVSAKNQYTGKMREVVDRFKSENPDLIGISDTVVIPWKVTVGVWLIVLGTILQLLG